MTSVCTAPSTAFRTDAAVNAALDAIDTALFLGCGGTIDPQDVLYYVTVPGVMDTITPAVALKVLQYFSEAFLSDFSLHSGACAVLQLIQVVVSRTEEPLVAAAAAVLTAATALVLDRVLARARPFMADVTERIGFSRLTVHTLQLLESKCGAMCSEYGVRAKWTAWAEACRADPSFVAAYAKECMCE